MLLLLKNNPAMAPNTIRIMMIDNDPAAHCYHQAMLVKAGLDKKYVSTYLEVSEALEDLQQIIDSGQTNMLPDVILVDINMPDMDGWAFIEQLEKLEFFDKPPKVYMVSNSLNPIDRRKVENSILIQDFKQKYLDRAFFKDLYASCK